jgi:hypothetical protein
MAAGWEGRMIARIRSRTTRDRLIQCLIVAIASAIALGAARPYAGGWNDGSRLATVESLVDEHTWIIDRSTFVQLPSTEAITSPSPYDPSEPALRAHGTLDKLFIHGHFYSDKSPVPALFLAAVYQVLKWVTGWTARAHADWFCWTMTLSCCGLAYALAVVCVHRLGELLRLPVAWNLAYTASFGLGTVALRYAEQVNNHILLLGVTAALALQIARIEREMRVGMMRRWRFAAVGGLAGLGYTIDLGVGPVILLCTAVLLLVFLRSTTRSPDLHTPFVAATGSGRSACWLFVLSAVPWLVLHHSINFAIGGTFRPANANAEFFCWPGSPFGVRNLTGSWAHEGPLSFCVYAASMLAGKRGFLGHNLPLFLCLPAFVLVIRRRRRHERGLVWAGAVCAGSWLLYAATSNNSSGQCCSIRWFVPLLAPGFFVLGVLLRQYPRYRSDFLVLSAWGVLLVALMREGPWMMHMVPFFWPIQAAALLSWALIHRWRLRMTHESADGLPPRSVAPTLLASGRFLQMGHQRAVTAMAAHYSHAADDSPQSAPDE